MNGEEIIHAKDESLAHLRRVHGDDAETLIADARYGFISGLLKDVLEKPAVETVTVPTGLTGWCLTGAWVFPCF